MELRMGKYGNCADRAFLGLWLDRIRVIVSFMSD